MRVVNIKVNTKKYFSQSLFLPHIHVIALGGIKHIVRSPNRLVTLIPGMSRGYSNLYKVYRSNNFSDIFNGEEQRTMLRMSLCQSKINLAFD